jgi:hypothetical protein
MNTTILTEEIKQAKLERLADIVNTCYADEWRGLPYRCYAEEIKDVITDEQLMTLDEHADFLDLDFDLDFDIGNIAIDIAASYHWTQEELDELIDGNQKLPLKEFHPKADTLLKARCLLRLDGRLIVQLYVQGPCDDDVFEEWIEREYDSAHDFVSTIK